ncbi:hypothetical protein [Pedobacter sp. V48]|uniref:hypothetical protein n=1 Tax=Pedobacter sp. V48 TaxID=509635 RepID=UPI0003E49B22|nr:hypothetical protein [Pedobacter sp. V48]ETZ23857.1 hypothetical protein N824_15075 [Pedobacter sp. V48]
MEKKLKLPFHRLESEFPILMSIEDLKSILGGTYGGANYGWDTNEGFLKNVGDMLSGGLFNATGSGDYSGTADIGDFSTGSGSGPSINPFGITGSGGSTPVINWVPTGSGSTQDGFKFGSASINGSNYSAAPLLGTYKGMTVKFLSTINGSGQVTSKAEFSTGSGGVKFEFSLNTTTGKTGWGLKIPF